jgi:hypothetical protein
MRPEWVRKGGNQFALNLAPHQKNRLVLTDLVLIVAPSAGAQDKP